MSTSEIADGLLNSSGSTSISRTESNKETETTSYKEAKRRLELPSISVYGDVPNLALAGGSIKVLHQTINNFNLTAPPRIESSGRSMIFHLP